MSQNKSAKGTGKTTKKGAIKPESLRELFNGDQIATQYKSTDSVSMDLVTHTSRWGRGSKEQLQGSLRKPPSAVTRTGVGLRASRELHCRICPAFNLPDTLSALVPVHSL